MNYIKKSLPLILLLISFVLLYSQVDTWMEKGQSALFKKKYDEAIK
ncbi:MAG: hypothetical protein HZB41_15340, partial [Ignavibacteriae bacterium]|nr:hypothetical protein [Ignavibacteriota bacterium]